MRVLCMMLCVGILAVSAAGCGGPKNSNVPEMPGEMGDMGGAGSGGASFSSTTALPGKYGPRAVYNGKEVSTIQADRVDNGIAMPDGQGGVVWVPGEPTQKPKSGYMDARELKLTAKELAEQLIMGVGSSMNGFVAMPVSFVNMDDLEQTSSFGRLMAEQMIYEFNQRGFAVREYRAPRSINVRDGDGDYYLTRALGDVNLTTCSVVIAGTYYADKQAIIVNARMIRPSDGRVLHTANAVLPASALARRMTGSGKLRLDGGGLGIRDYKEVTQPKVSVNPIDQGADVH